ncbi:MAG TPA: hypothetical protein VF634_11850 [Pyrinomonadaceae bacterium]
MRTRRTISLVLAVVSLSGLSCEWMRTRNYNIDKASPNGTYRVRIDARVQDDEQNYFGFHEQVKIRFFKGQEIVLSREWQRTDSMEATFVQAHPVVEWASDNVLRMGAEIAGRPFLDEIIVSNQSGEQLKYVDVSYGRYESFTGFDVAAGNTMTLHVAPVFQSGPTLADYNFVGYGGETTSGKKFEGNLKDERRRIPADGQLKFKITINAEDLR